MDRGPVSTMRTLRSKLCASLPLLALSAAAMAQNANPASPPLAHFHHVHLNSVDPAAAIEFYTTRFKARKERFAGLADAVWTGDSWLLFNKVADAPASELLSGIWHIGWGAEDMPAAYRKQVAAGTKFATPLSDISDLVGGGRTFYYAYVDGPDHALIELNTARHHDFGHVHMFSADPPAAGEWYTKHFGFRAFTQKEARIYKDVPDAPAAFVTADHVSMIVSRPCGRSAASWRRRAVASSITWASASRTWRRLSRACAARACRSRRSRAALPMASWSSPSSKGPTGSRSS
jgi:catechol 2,3-dioxygenase-like lactoylglutathione lyase family enzyme